MTAGWESLDDWLHDTARELGHIVKPRPRPVPVPSLEEMPDPHRRPGCENHTVTVDQIPCGADADWRLRVHGVDDHTLVHGSLPVLLCDRHKTRFEEAWERQLQVGRWKCGPCGRSYRVLSDVVEDRHRL